MRLIVWLHGLHAGTLDRGPGGRWEFRFEREFLARGDQPVLGRWFEDRDKAELVLFHPQMSLPNFFDNYLPASGSALRELLARHAGVSSSRAHDLLAALGVDLPGAVVVQRLDDGAADPESPPARDAPTALSDQALRFSLAGVQLKFSVLRTADSFTMPASGRGGRWIAKFPDRLHAGLPSHEYAMYSLARDVGISVPACELVQIDGISGLPDELDLPENEAFIVERYDRSRDGTAIHQEDFAQVLDRAPDDKYNDQNQRGLRSSYDSIGQIVRAVCGPEDFAEYIRRLVFMVLIGNGDAHLKNWSLVYPDRRRARLSPAYDLVSTVAYQPPDRRRQESLALKIFRKRDFADVQFADFEKLAIVCGDDPVAIRSLVVETVDAFSEAWGRTASALPLTEHARAAIAAHLATLALQP